MTALAARILGVSVWAPGLEGWDAARAVLAGEAPYEPSTAPLPPPASLPPAERRRSGPVVRLALTVADEAATRSGLPAGSLRSVFASSNGDGLVLGAILDSLATRNAADRPVSPTQFHNSVHNAAAGYWSIAHASQQPTTSIALHDDSWAAALVTTLAEIVAEQVPVLLCAYDHPFAPPLAAKRPTLAPFGLGLVLAPVAEDVPGARLSIRFTPRQAAVPPLPRDARLHGLAGGNVIARGLRVLEALATGQPDVHELPYLDGALSVSVAP